MANQKTSYQRAIPDDLMEFSFEDLADIKKYEPERYARMDNESKDRYEAYLRYQRSAKDRKKQKEAELKTNILTAVIIIVGGIIAGFLFYKFL